MIAATLDYGKVGSLALIMLVVEIKFKHI